MSTNAKIKMTLADFGPDSVWFTSVGIPTGVTIDLAHGVDEETGEPYEIDPYDASQSLPFEWDLEGTIDDDGDWNWDGQGPCHDWNRNSVTAISASRTDPHDEQPVDCACCDREIPEADRSTVPGPGDDAGWDRLAGQHAPGCEWIATRAHRLDLLDLPHHEREEPRR